MCDVNLLACGSPENRQIQHRRSYFDYFRHSATQKKFSMPSAHFCEHKNRSGMGWMGKKQTWDADF